MNDTYTLPTDVADAISSVADDMQKADKTIQGNIVGIEWAGTFPVLLIDKDGDISMQRIDDYGIYRFSPK